MELWTSIRTIVRRWYVVIPCVAITAFVAVQLAGGVKPQYKAEGTVVFLRPLGGSDASVAPGNPWQTVDYSLNQFALLMGQAADSPAFQERVRQAGGSTTFSVTTSATQTQGSPTNQTPTLTLSVIADTPDTAMASYGILGDALDQEVRDRQRSVGASEDTWITAVDLTVPPGAIELVGSRLTVMIAAALVGVLLTLGAVFLIDGFLAGRSREEAASVTLVADHGSTLRPESAAKEPFDADDLSLDDLIEDWPDDRSAGPRRPAIAGRRDRRDDSPDRNDRNDRNGPDEVGDVVGL